MKPFRINLWGYYGGIGIIDQFRKKQQAKPVNIIVIEITSGLMIITN